MKYFRSFGTNAVHPSFGKNKSCTFMLLKNLAEPDWIHISCKIKRFYLVICVNETSLKSISGHNINTEMKCPLTSFVIKNTCLQFKWKYKGERIKLKLISSTMSQIMKSQLYHVFDALILENSYMIILSGHNMQLVQYLKVTKI